jgi:predicted transcriptional regulator
MDDYLEEELQIMKERDKEAPALSGDTFKLPISELTFRPIKPIDVSSTIGDAIKIMQENKVGSVAITKEKKLAGIFTERDVLLKVLGSDKYDMDTNITEVMTKDPVYLLKDDKIAYLMHNMHVGGFRHIPIVDENKEPVTIISIKGVNSFILDFFPESVMNITSRPYRGSSKREDA